MVETDDVIFHQTTNAGFSEVAAAEREREEAGHAGRASVERPRLREREARTDDSDETDF
jgi:hypothetical protein